MEQHQHPFIFTTGLFRYDHSVPREQSWSLMGWGWLCWPVSSFAVLTELQRGQGLLSWGLLCPTTLELLAKLFPVQDRKDAATALCHCSTSTLLVHGQPVDCQVPASSAKLLSSCFVPSMYVLVPGVIPPQVQGFAYWTLWASSLFIPSACWGLWRVIQLSNLSTSMGVHSGSALVNEGVEHFWPPAEILFYLIQLKFSSVKDWFLSATCDSHTPFSCCLLKETLKLSKVNFSVGNGQNIEVLSDLVWGLLLISVQFTIKMFGEQWKADTKQHTPK